MTSTVSDRHAIAPRTSFRRGLNYIAVLIGIGLTYLVLAKSGLALALIHPSASAIWPPTGFALAAIVLWGYRVWPAIFLAAMIANATTFGSIGAAISIATGNSLEALVGAALINVWCNGRDTFSTANTVAKFAVVCAALATPISATVGTASLALAGQAEWTNFANIWLTWWLGDMISALVVTPVIVLLAQSDARAFRRTELIESAAVIALAVAVGFIAFNPLFKHSQQPDALGFLAVLPLLWAALRRGPRDTAIASLILATFAIWGTFSGAGSFAAASLNDSLLFVLVFLISVSVPSLALSADVAMRKTIEENLRRTQTELDRRVEIRTAELATANHALQDEVSRRAGAEKEALEQQTATSEVLRVISSSPGELQPVFRAIVENAVRICDAKEGILFLHEDGIFTPTAARGLLPEFSEFISKRGPFRPGPNTVNGHLWRTKQVTHWDVGHIDSTLVQLSAARTTLGVPMLEDDVLIGSIVIFRQEPRPFTDKQIAVLQSFAAQAVIAIENTRLLSELRARTSELTRSVEEIENKSRQLELANQALRDEVSRRAVTEKEALELQMATSEVLRVIASSPGELQSVFRAMLENAVRLCEGREGVLFLHEDGIFTPQVTRGVWPEFGEFLSKRGSFRPGPNTTNGRLLRTKQVSHADAGAEPVPDTVAKLSRARTTLGVPMLKDDVLIGSIVIFRQEVRPFTDKQIALVQNFADQAVIAIENTRLLGELRARTSELTRSVEEIENKSRQVELANTAKSRFLAMASHDLRQPLHALGLFVAQLRTPLKRGERTKTIERVDAAVREMSEMFNSLLDISKLDAGVLTPRIVEFPIARLLQKIETTFDPAAREKGIRLCVIGSDAWVRSDALLLERILLNLASNAMRYTLRGGVIVGCRRRGGMLRIEVWDSGPGIPEGHRQNIFGEFFQLPIAERDRYGGLGLGLAIVDRLRRLLNHEIELTSTVGRGSRFTIVVPTAAAGVTSVETVRSSHPAAFAVEGKVILVIDDDPIVLEGTRGLLGKWGYSVVTAGSDDAALIQLAEREQRHPDLIISDFHLSNGKTGIEAIERIDAAFGASIPAVLISGDTAPERLRDAKARGYILLHKPVDPMRLRAVMHELFRVHDNRRGTAGALKGSAL